MHIRTFIDLEEAFSKRLIRDWKKESAPLYAAITQACKEKHWDEARSLVTNLNLGAVGKRNKEWIRFLLLSFFNYGAARVAKGKPTLQGFGFSQTLNQVTNNVISYLSNEATKQIQQQALQLIAQDEKESTAKKRDYDYGIVMVSIHPDSDVARSLNEARSQISDEDLWGQGKDIDGNHVTVRYGIKGKVGDIVDYLRRQVPFGLVLGKVHVFPPSESSENTCPVVVEIYSQDLHQLNSGLEQVGSWAPSSFPEYHPHATLAYVKPEAAEKYKLLNVQGAQYWCPYLTVTTPEGERQEVWLQGVEGHGQDYSLHSVKEDPYHDAEGKFTDKEHAVEGLITGTGWFTKEGKFLANAMYQHSDNALKHGLGSNKKKGGPVWDAIKNGHVRVQETKDYTGLEGADSASSIRKALEAVIHPDDRRVVVAAFSSPKDFVYFDGSLKEAKQWAKQDKLVQKSDPYHDKEGKFTDKEHSNEGTEYFHGTLLSALNSIKEQGLVPGHGGGADEWAKNSGWKTIATDSARRKAAIYMTKDEWTAIHYAETVLGTKADEAIILKFKIPAEVEKNFKKDKLDQNAVSYEGVLKPEWLEQYKVDNPYRDSKDLKWVDVKKQDGCILYVIVPIKKEVEKADDTGRFVTPFVSFDNQGDEQLQLIASLNASRLATWGFTAEAEVRGIKRYKLTAVLDGRICPFCRMMNGKEFEVSDARNKITEALSAQNPEDLKIIQPWPKQTQTAMEEYRNFSEADFVKKGLQIPPFHAGCRCVLTMEEIPLEKPAVQNSPLPEQTITQDTLKELKVTATEKDVDHWNRYVKLNPIQVLQSLSGKDPKQILESPNKNSIQFLKNGDIGMNAVGIMDDVKYSVGTILDPYTGTYYLTHADFVLGDVDAGRQFLGRLFQSLETIGKSSAAKVLIVAVAAGEAASYVRLGFLPSQQQWDQIRQQALAEMKNGSLVQMAGSLSEDQLRLLENLLQDHDPSSAVVLVNLDVDYEGESIGDLIFQNVSGNFSLNLKS